MLRVAINDCFGRGIVINAVQMKLERDESDNPDNYLYWVGNESGEIQGVGYFYFDMECPGIVGPGKLCFTWVEYRLDTQLDIEIEDFQYEKAPRPAFSRPQYYQQLN